jgi:hypothetical protein
MKDDLQKAAQDLYTALQYGPYQVTAKRLARELRALREALAKRAKSDYVA